MTEAEKVSAEEEKLQRIKDNKKLNFWQWLGRMNPEGNNIVYKLVPGLASFAALVVFIIKLMASIAASGNEKIRIFTELNVTYFFYGINLIILVFIVLLGLNKKKRDATLFTSLGYDHIEKSEGQFLATVKWFFGVTILLYMLLLVETVNDETNTSIFSARSSILQVIRGKDKVKKGLDSTFSILQVIRGKDKVENYVDSTMIAQMDIGCSDLKNGTDSLINSGNDSIIQVSKRCAVHNLQVAIKGSLAINKKEDPKTELSKSTIDNFIKINKWIGDTIESLNKSLLRTNNNLTPKQYLTMLHGMNLLYQGHSIIANACDGFDASGAPAGIIQILELLVSNIGGIFIFSCFLVLYCKTIDKDKDEKLVSNIKFPYVIFSNKPYDKKEGKLSPGYVIKILQTVIYLLIGLTVIECLVEGIANGHDRDDWFHIFRLVSGIFNALAMCLLFARFESGHFQSTLTVLILLYLYAVIQAFFGLFDMPFLGNKYFIKDATTCIAFVGKCFLYLYILWIYRTDRLMYYFYHKEKKSPTSPSWDEFLDLTNKKPNT